MFTGFTQETSDFLWELAFHNERPWFQEHKEQFLRCLKEPFDVLAKETLSGLSERFPEELFQLHISRIYRDARRLYGRGPYKDHLWFSLWTGTEKHDNPGFWFELSASRFSYGVGFFGMTAGQAEDYRRFFDTDRGQMERLARTIAEQERFRLVGEDYKRPRGNYGALLDPWYNKKWVGLERSGDFGGELLSPELPRILAEDFAALMPYYEFFRRFRETERRAAGTI